MHKCAKYLVGLGFKGYNPDPEPEKEQDPDPEDNDLGMLVFYSTGKQPTYSRTPHSSSSVTLSFHAHDSKSIFTVYGISLK